MPSIKEIIQTLENIAPLSLQENYDNAGLIVGNENQEVTGILVALDCIEEVVDEAIRTGCNLIIAHHPIIFSGIKKLNGKNYVERTVIKAIQNNIAGYASHTNLDNVHEGVNRKICEKIGLKNPTVLAPKKNALRKLVTFCPKDKADTIRTALFEAGCGHIGNYDECSFNTDGTGTFRASENSNPYVGEKGKRHGESETRIETIFPVHLERNVIAALLSAHPYEEVAYDIYPLENMHPQTGAGMVGELESAIDEHEFLTRIKSVMKTGVIRHTRLLGKKVSKIAVCGGSGSFLLQEAIRSVTSELAKQFM